MGASYDPMIADDAARTRVTLQSVHIFATEYFHCVQLKLHAAAIIGKCFEWIVL